MHKKRKIFRVAAIVVVFFGTVAYLLADRYLIQHVEIANVNAAALTEAASAESIATETQAATGEATQTVVSDDWHYQSSDLSITITQMTTGSGDDTVTYYVADVVLSDATQLESAFADDSFGRNIIEYTSVIAQENNAIFAINGDYYGFRDDGIEIRNGVVYQYIPARIGLAFYLDGSMQIYDEMQTTAEELLAAGVWNTLSFGPAILENSEIVPNLGTVEIDTNFGNHSIQGSNPRTGVGIIDENHFIFIVVDGRSPGYSRGVTLNEFAQIFKDLGCTEAYNLDGGGSSTMYFMGRVVNNPLGRNHERGTSDILFIAE